MTNAEKYINEETTKVLIELGLPINLQGFKYCKKCVELVCKDPTMMETVTKRLYPAVAYCFEVKPSVIERCMRHATDLAFFKTKFKPINALFGISEKNIWQYKPSNSELVALISEYIRGQLDKKGLLEELEAM